MADQVLRRLDVTNRRLLETLESADPAITNENIAQLLKRNEDKILKGLDYYKTPSKESKDKIQSGKVEWRGRTYEVDAQQKTFVNQISSRLNLDEYQSFGVLQNFLRVEVKGQKFQYNDTTLEEITEHYYDERICLLTIISSLLRNGLDEGYAYYPAVSEFVDANVNKIEEQIINSYKKSWEVQQPKSLQRQQAEKWAIQLVNEQSALLEVIFLIYYVRVICSPTKRMSLIQMFKNQGFCTKHPHYSMLNEFGRAIVKKMGYICILIVIEILNLESFLDSELDEAALDLLKRKDTGILALNEGFSTAEWGTIVEHGPILFAWGSLLCRINQITGSEDFAYKPFIQKALELDSINYLIVVLDQGFTLDDVNLTGYKSVLKGLLNIILTAFPIDHQHQPRFIDFHRIVFQGQAMLARQFWEQDYPREALRSLLDSAHRCFPYEFSPLMRILTPLAGDAHCAAIVFNFLSDLSYYRQAWADQSGSDAIEELTMTDVPAVRVRHPLLIDNIELPAGAVGRLFALEQDQKTTTIIEWRVRYSAWTVFFSAIDGFIQRILSGGRLTDSNTSHLQLTLELLASLISKDSAISTSLHEYLADYYVLPKGITYLQDAGIDKSNIIARLFIILRHYSQAANPSLELLGACVSCLKGYAIQDPASVWQYIKSTGILDFSKRSDSYTGAIRQLLDSVESVKGDYPVTLSFLDLLSSLLSYFQKWNKDAVLSPNDFFPYLTYVRNLFAYYESWHYKSILDRWELGTKVLKIFYAILKDEYPRGNVNKSHTLKHSLLQSLLNDASFHHSLLNIIATGPFLIEYMLNRRRIKEGQTLEQLVLLSFSVLESVLLLKDNDAISSLEYSIFSRKVGKNNSDLVYVIASYISFSYNSQLPLLATRVLTILCNVGSGSGRAPSLIAFFGDQSEQLRTTFLWKLSDRREILDLKVAILRLITTSLDSQPGLAELFINIPTTTDQKDAQHDGSDESAAKSCIDIILSFMKEQDVIVKLHPRLYSEALYFMCSLWKIAPEHQNIISFLRKKDNFWSLLLKPLEKDPYADPLNNTNASVDQEEIEHSAECYRLLSHCWILKILSLEIFYVPKNGPLDATLQTAIKKYREERTVLNWIDTYTRTNYDPELKKKFVAECHKMNIDAEACVVLETEKFYGKNYYYDAGLLKRKFGLGGSANELIPAEPVSMFANQTGLQLEERCQNVIRMAQQVNEHLSLNDAQAQVLTNWSSFVQVLVVRQSELAKATPTETAALARRLAATSPTSFSVALALAVVARNGGREMAGGPRVVAALSSLAVCLQSAMDNLHNDPRLVQTLLSTILTLLKTEGKWSEDLAQKTMLILPNVLACLEFSTLKITSLAILEVICRNYLDSQVLLSQLTVHGTISRLVNDLSFVLNSQKDSDLAQAILVLFLTLAQTQTMSEVLAVQQIMMAICNESFAIFATQKMFPYSEQGERNGWHKVWCYTLSLVTTLLQSLGVAEKFVDQVFQFVWMYQDRIVKVLDFSQTRKTDISQELKEKAMAKKSSLSSTSAPSQTGSSTDHPCLSIASLDETERVTALMWALGRYQTKWQFTMDRLATRLQILTLKNIQSATLLLVHSPQLIKWSTPVSGAERKAHKKPTRNIEGKPAPIVPPSPSKPATDSTAGANEIKISDMPFVGKIEALIWHILRNSLSLASRLTPAKYGQSDLDMIDEDDASLTFQPLFTPQIDTNFHETPSLGTLLSCLHICNVNLRKSMVANDSSDNKAQISMLLYVIEHTIHIVMAHIGVYITPKYSELVRRKVRDELGTEIETQIGRVSRDLAKFLGKSNLTKEQQTKTNDYFKSIEECLKSLIRTPLS